MTDKQPEALRLADQCEAMAAIWANEIETRLQAAALLRAQHAEIERLTRIEAAWNEWLDKTEWVQKSAQPKELGMHRADVLRARIERKDALLRQALEMLGCTHEEGDPGHRCGHCDDYVDRNGILRAAITKELSQ